jgi:hypothetical protein
MMIDFARATAIHPTGDHTFRAEIPDGWQQGRGAFGGLVLAALLRAIEESEPDRARTARTLSGDLCGPVLAGPAEIRVRVLRRGSNQSNLAAELVQHGEVLATASAVLSAPRKATIAQPPLAPPPPETWSDAPVVPIGPPLGPVFTQHYEYRTRAPMPFASTRPEPICEGWIRERAPLAKLDAPALIGRLDAWWPTSFSVDPAPRPLATISFTAELLVDPATLVPGEPLRYRASMAALHEGFFVELRELWRGDRPVALNQQTFVLIR